MRYSLERDAVLFEMRYGTPLEEKATINFRDMTTRIAQQQARIDAARAANAEAPQCHPERRKRELEINEKYGAEAKEAEETAKKDEANLEYEAAKTVT
jgi:hypothetical protein